MVSDGEVESCLKRTRYLSDDHYGQVGRAFYPYFPGLGVQVGQHLVGFQPCWFPGGSVGIRSPIVSGSYVQAIRPSVLPAPLASPPSPDASGEIDLRWVS